MSNKNDDLDASIQEAVERVGSSLAALSKELGIPRSTIWGRLKKMPVPKPMADGTVRGMEEKLIVISPPALGTIARFILTSAQNNTYVHKPTWNALQHLAKHYNAQIFVGTFTYNQNAFGQLSVKRGTAKHDDDLWYDPVIEPFVRDERVQLAPGLVWCGEMNILPTAENPLSGLDTYSGRKSAIFPHAKIALQSIAAMQGEDVKFNYTTGTVTQMNYIQKKAGLKGEHHHAYGGLLVEVDSSGTWFVRQIEATKEGVIYDLDVRADSEGVTTGHQVVSITWGDIHAACHDNGCLTAAVRGEGMLNILKPQYQFMHDIFEGVSFSHHVAKNCHDKFEAFVRGFDDVLIEARTTAEILRLYHRPDCRMVVVDSNHDSAWLVRWLAEHDYRRDPRNAILFLRMQLAYYEAIESGTSINLAKWLLNAFVEKDSEFYGIMDSVKFLATDESYPTCNGRIENGMHGHLGPNGARGTPKNLNKIGRRSNTAHTHQAEIINGLYVAGTSGVLKMGYNKGPSGWSHSHIVTYPNGKRTIITLYNGNWRAQ